MKSITKKLLIILIASLITYFIAFSIPEIIEKWTALSLIAKNVLEVAAYSSLGIVIFCFFGCYIQLKRTSRKSLAYKKLIVLEEIVDLTRAAITEFEGRMANGYYLIDHNTIEKLAPAKWILNSLEKRLHALNIAKHVVSLKKLNLYLDQEIDLHSSPVNVVVCSESCQSLPKSLNLSDCAFVLKDILNEVKSDLDFIENMAFRNKCKDLIVWENFALSKMN